jgi:hypothetical protein
MRQSRSIYLVFIVALLLLVSLTLMPGMMNSSLEAQEQPTVPPPTFTFTPTATSEGPVTPPVTPPPPVPIPEPITVVLFGTGLAALSAAAASRRKKDDGE